MLFRSYWRKLISRLVSKTPGLGHEAEADQAVKCSNDAIKDSRRIHATVDRDSVYLREVQQRNHYKDTVMDALTVRRPAR